MEIECKIKVRISDERLVMQKAEAIGRETGRDRGWSPKDLNEALTEILLMSDAPAECGVEIIESDALRPEVPGISL